MKKFLSLISFAVALCACSEDGAEAPVPVVCPANPIELTRAENNACQHAKAFSYDFVRQVNAEARGENYFVSPLSAEVALAMLSNGTAGDTEQEIRKVLVGDDFTIDDLNSYNMKMLHVLPNIDGRTKMAMANGFWAEKSLCLQPPFQSLISEQYDASCFAFDNLASAKKEINRWCDEHTNHMIREIMGEDDSFVFALVNALYFKGEWARKFKAEETQTKPFHNQDGTTTQVPMMHKTTDTGLLNYGFNDYCHALFMPFGNSAFSFTVILPAEGYTLDDCVARLSGEAMTELHNQYHGECVLVELPRFELEYKCSLNDVLRRMGIRQLFTEEQDLSGMLATDAPLAIDVKQKARIEVDEKGAKAAAVTHVSGDNMMAGPVDPEHWEFVVDEPFLFFISERSTGSVLFTGRVNTL